MDVLFDFFLPSFSKGFLLVALGFGLVLSVKKIKFWKEKRTNKFENIKFSRVSLIIFGVFEIITLFIDTLHHA